MKKYYIYKLIDMTNGYVYIGWTVNIRKRILRHFRDAYNKKYLRCKLHNAIRTHGKENFIYSILFETDDKLLSLKMEKFFIKHISSKIPNGYNMNDGGAGNDGPYNNFRSQEYRNKISKTLTGCKLGPHGQEWNDRLSKSHEKIWEITFPSGEITIITNLFKFCIENNLDQGAMSKVANKKRNHHHNYKVKPKNL